MRLACALLALALALAVRADTVTFIDGGTDHGKVTHQDAETVVLNLYNSTMEQMTWGVRRLAAQNVSRVEIVPEDPLRKYWLDSSAPAAYHDTMMKFCRANGLDVEAREEALLALADAPDNADARAVLGADAEAVLRASPLHNKDLRSSIADWAKLEAPARKAAYDRLRKDFGVTLPIQYFDRVTRADPGSRGKVTEGVRLTYNTQKASGVYAVWVPKEYNPHRAWPLILALHGTWNGLGGIGNGHDFIKHLTYAETKKWSTIIVAPTADPRPWTAKGDDFVLSVIDEAMLRYNVDMNRVYVIGHSMGGGGTWHFGTKYPEKFAAFAPQASAGSGQVLKAHEQGTGVYIYHSSDDSVASCERDRLAARELRAVNADFVYSEWHDQDHGWPQEVIADAMIYFRRHHRMERGKDKPVPCRGMRPSFAEPLWPDEEKYFPVPRPVNPRTEIADLLGEIELGGTVAGKAADRLLALKDRNAIPGLAVIVQDVKGRCDEARIEAARALGAVKDEGAAQVLLKALADPEFKVRIAAAEAFGKAGSKTDSIALSSAILAFEKDFDLLAKSGWIRDETWAQLHALNAVLVEDLCRMGDTRCVGPILDICVRKILLTEVKSGSIHIDPEPARRASAIRIARALPMMKEQKLKSALGMMFVRLGKDLAVAAALAEAAGQW